MHPWQLRRDDIGVKVLSGTLYQYQTLKAANMRILHGNTPHLRKRAELSGAVA